MTEKLLKRNVSKEFLLVEWWVKKWSKLLVSKRSRRYLFYGNPK